MADDSTPDAATLAEESRQAHHIMSELRQIVGRVLFGEANDEREMGDTLGQADVWITAWRERRVTTQSEVT